RESLKLQDALTNPNTLQDPSRQTDPYIDNVNHIDLVLKSKKPTKEQIAFILNLLNSDNSYKEYFFSKIDKPVWFRILKDHGFFNCATNPQPIKVTDGYQIPMWHPLQYLERLSISISQGNNA